MCFSKHAAATYHVVISYIKKHKSSILQIPTKIGFKTDLYEIKVEQLWPK